MLSRVPKVLPRRTQYKALIFAMAPGIIILSARAEQQETNYVNASRASNIRDKWISIIHRVDYVSVCVFYINLDSNLPSAICVRDLTIYAKKKISNLSSIQFRIALNRIYRGYTRDAVLIQ